MIVFVLISLSCTSAANNQTADIVAQDIDLVTDEILTDGNNEAGDFSELDDEIANATSKTLELKKNYTYDAQKDTKYIDGINITIDDFTIDGKGFTISGNNKASIFCTNATNVTLKNINFINAFSEFGAAIFGYDGNLTIINCNFTNNSINATDNHGGAIYFEGDSLTIINSKFINNTAKESYCDGGAIYFFAMDLSIIECEFINNQAFDAGAVYVSGRNVVINKSKFINNNARDCGALLSYSNQILINECNFTNNSANFAGAIGNYYDEFNAIMTINNSIFENNHVETSASAIRNGQYATCILTNNIFKNNWGNEYNNTIDSNQGKLYLSNNTINTKRAEIYNYPGIEFGKITSKVTATVLNNMTLPTSFEDEVVLSVVIRDDNGNLIELPFGVYFKINNNTEEVSAEFDGKTGSYTWDYIIREDGLVTVSIECESFDNLTIETATYNVTAIDVNVVNISSASYGDTVNIVVNVTQEGIGLNGTVSVNINNNKYNATIVNGSGTIEIPNLNAGSYSSAMVFTGKEFEYPISKEVSFNVLKDKSILTAKDSSYVINYGGKYSVTLKDVEGNAIVGKTVTFTLNGKNIGSAVTGSNGAATITLTAKTLKTAKAGKKNLVIKFESVNYYVVSKTVKITVNKEKTKITAKNKKFKKSKKIKKYAILLKNSKGKAISKQKVILKVNGKNYIAKTNAKGKAIFKIKKLNKKGKFSAKITFKGNSYYNKAVKKIKLNIK